MNLEKSLFPESGFVSTGSLPPSERVTELIQEAYSRFQNHAEGKNSEVYPALTQVPANHFGICVVSTQGTIYAVGDAGTEFTLMSVSKPFVFALVVQALGVDKVRQYVGVNATGDVFNSLAAIDRHPEGKTNPMVNSGAISTTSLVPGNDLAAKWQFLSEGLMRFAGRPLSLNEEVYQSASATNSRNQTIAQALHRHGRIAMDPPAAVDLYTRQCSLNVSAQDLAIMGATLAGGGVNPLTRQRVVEASVCHYTLAVMATSGLYESSGDWLFDIGLPGKSGISGGIVTVSPGKGALGTFAPPLDPAGNSVKGQLVAKFLSQQLGMDLFVSQTQI